MPDFTVIVSLYGPAVAFLLFVVLPLLRDKFAPWVAAERREARERALRNEERLLDVLSANTEAFTEMRGTLERITDQLAGMAEAQNRLNEDVAGLYGHIGVSRPSREVQPVSVQPPISPPAPALPPRRRKTDK